MFRHLVAALDGSESSLRALDVAIELAARAGATLDVVSVEEELPRYLATHEESAAERSTADSYFAHLHDEARRRAERVGITPRATLLRGHEVQALVDYVCADGYDLLVVGHRGHSGVWGTFLGSTADKLVGHTPCSVLVIREPGAARVFRRIMLGLDGSPLGQRALEAALELARLAGASLHGVSVVEGLASGGSERGHVWADFFSGVQAAAAAEAAKAGVSFEADIRQGHAAEVIIAEAKARDCDLIVVGATGHERPWSPTTGGTARKTANEAGSAVLVVRPPLVARRVRHVMTRQVAAVTPEATTAEMMDILVQRGIKAVPVVDEGRQVVGIVTGGDLLSRGHLGLRLSVHRDLTPEEVADEIRALEASGQRARDVMTPNPVTVGDEAPLERAIHLMATRNLKRLPVTDAEGRLVGILSRTDVLRHLAAATEPPAEAHEALPVRARTAGEIMEPEVPTVPETALAEVVLQRVLSTPLRRVVVVAPTGQASGIITDRDLLAYADPALRPGILQALAGRLAPPVAGLAAGRATGPITAATLMRPQVFAVRPDTPLVEAIRLMVARRVKRLVVLDAEGRPVGVVDRQRLLQSLVEKGDVSS